MVAFPGYSEQRLRELMVRSIALRWPDERLLLLTRARRLPAWESGPAGGGESTAATARASGGDDDGFVAVTQRRLFFRERTSGPALIRTTGLLFGILSLAILAFGGDVMGAFAIGAVAGMVWGGGWLAEVTGSTNGDLSFDRILRTDFEEQLLEGITSGGVPFRVHVKDPSDFRMVAAIVAGHEASAA